MTTVPPVLISTERIARRVEELAQQISADYTGTRELVLVGILKGAFIFLADLARRLEIPRRVEFIALSSYGQDGAAQGGVRILMDLRGSVAGLDVLIVEDIVDSGATLSHLVQLLSTHDPSSVRTCALVRKPSAATTGITVDYLGFDIPDEWVVGYGLDYAEQFRTLPYIGTVKPREG